MRARAPWWLSALLWLAAACTVPGSEVSDAELRTLERLRYAAPTGSVAALRAGDPAGVRVIYVHGTPGSARAWARYLLDPLPGTDSVAIDRPGFGASDPRGAVASMAEQAAALEPLLVAHAGHEAVLVGHSLAGAIVAKAAAEHPEHVGGLVVISGSLDPALEELHWYNRVGRWVEPLLPRSLRNSNRELYPFRAELEALAPELERIRCPVVILHGRRDRLVPFENALYLRARLSAAASVRLVELPEGDHFLPWNSEPLVREAVGALVSPRA